MAGDSDNPPESLVNVEKSAGCLKLEQWLNRSMRIQMTDGRTLIGIFLCTDKDYNVILGSCEEYLHPPDPGSNEEPRLLGLAMVPGHHIVRIQVDSDGPPIDDDQDIM